MYAFDRTENDTTKRITSAEALAELNEAQMGGRRNVRQMSSGTTKHRIQYKDGRDVTLVRVEVTEEPAGRVISVNGGEVHSLSAWTTPGRVYAQCRVSARTRYVETTRARTCAVCLENERRGQ